ncbi:MAG: hypothetical protein JWM57_508 [Phycisphaerales bacterium]|nr:hypothetical protein [Phycisphaerales bacterium]
MLDCVPRGVFSWTFDINGAAEGPASVTFNFFTEQGTLTLGAEDYAVRKLGPGSGRWELVGAAGVVAEAHKPSAFHRQYEITGVGGPLTVQATMPVARSFDLLSADRPIGHISPNSMFRRRATIECAADVPAIDQIFAFWLVVLLWKRAARNSKSPS